MGQQHATLPEIDEYARRNRALPGIYERATHAPEEEAVDAPLTVAVARYMVYFWKQPKQQRQLTVIEWMRYADLAGVHFFYFGRFLRLV